MKQTSITPIYENYTIEKALECITNDCLNIGNVLNAKNQIIGTISVGNLFAAKKHKLDSYPVSMIIDYFELKPKEIKAPSKEEMVNRITQLLPHHYLEVIKATSSCADKHNIKAYLVGGLVRDLVRNDTNLDIDITVESNGVEFAQTLDQCPNNIYLKEKHNEFGTAKVIYDVPETKIDIDIASTRKETYYKPGALPTIEQIPCDLKDDLKRRDFTINAMALSINSDNYAKLIDVAGGLDDINNKLIRVMHCLSFIDDPTRIIRGIEFVVRFNYKFSPATEKLIKNAVSSGIFDGYCSDRLKLEIKPPLNLNSLKVLKYFEDFQVYRMLDASIKWDESYLFFLDNLMNNINIFSEYIDKDNIWLIYLAGILHNQNDAKVSEITEKLYMNNKDKNIVLEGLQLYRKTQDSVLPVRPSKIYNFYNGYTPESIVISSFKRSDKDTLNNIQKYLAKYSKVRIFTKGYTLIELGLQPGEIFSEILNALKGLKLDGIIKSEEDELNYIKANYLS